jgi:hypothetical protein
MFGLRMLEQSPRVHRVRFLPVTRAEVEGSDMSDRPGKTKILWKQSEEERQEFAALDGTQQAWVLAEIAKRQKLESLRCSACDNAPAVVIRFQVIYPPRAQELGVKPGDSFLGISHYCTHHDNQAGYDAMEMRAVQLARENRTTLHGSDNEIIAFD